ncbi:hypothetical protein HHK36_000043 [Tetracentron sinense]|uniref:Uncharacterized protein n=1 Tax=Tetracentron sinense TaxID=13715 RepID=A0A834ZQZ0_TETSI|nr:hypothetical protein HHK36_000043 [Tetracentron sinense]
MGLIMFQLQMPSSEYLGNHGRYHGPLKPFCYARLDCFFLVRWMLDSSIPGPHGKFQQGIFDIRRPKPIQRPLKDVAKSLAGIAIFHRCLARFCPLPSDWFKFRLKGRWEIDVGLGCLMFPLVNWLSQVSLDILPFLPSLHLSLHQVLSSQLWHVTHLQWPCTRW